MMKFPLGRLLTTPGVIRTVPEKRMAVCIRRHATGDWGVVDADDARANDRALEDGTRLLSAYPINPALPCKGYGDNCLWIVTEADRSVTTLLLPSEY